MDIIIFSILNFIVILSGVLFAFRLLKSDDFIDSLISCFIVIFSQIVLSELVLGMAGVLFLKNVILLNLAILFTVWLAAKNRPSNFTQLKAKTSAAEFFRNKVTLFLIAIILSFGAVKVLINLMNPPFGWDSLNYHFTFAVEWFKHGNLNTPITVFDDPSPTYYPLNGSLFYLWLMLPLKNVFLADLGQLPFFILAFLSVYNIAKKAGLTKEYSFYAAALFVLIPNFFKQLQIAYVDLMVAGLFLACVNFLFLLNESFTWRNILPYSLGLGLLLGTKTTALFYSVLLLLPFIYIAARNIKRIYLFVIPLLALLVFGLFSYLRNFFETGNPLYPLDFRLFGRVIFKGVIDLGLYQLRFSAQDYSLGKILFHEGLGAQSLILILPSVFLALPIALIKKRGKLSFNFIYFLILPVLLFLVYRYFIPLGNIRYLYCLLGIGMVLGFYLADILNIPKVVVKILVVACAISSMAELAKRQELTSSLILTFTVFLFLSLLIKKIKLGWLKKPFSLFLVSLIFILALIPAENWYLKNEFPRYLKMVKYSGFWPDAAKAWDWLNNKTCANNIAYVGRPVPFPLYGSNFKNNVFYVSVNKTDPAKLQYYPDSRYIWDADFLSMHKSFEAKGNYRSGADFSVWRTNLMRRNADFLFVYSLHQTKELAFPMEDSWASAHPDKFTLVFANTTVHIYQILK